MPRKGEGKKSVKKKKDKRARPAFCRGGKKGKGEKSPPDGEKLKTSNGKGGNNDPSPISKKKTDPKHYESSQERKGTFWSSF